MLSAPDTRVATVQNIQALRALAALLVVFVHLGKLLASFGMQPFGQAGVDIFFVISGFIMVYTTMGKRPSPLSFICHRVARIVPIYWTMTLVVFGIALMAPVLLQSTKGDWGDLLKSLLFIPFKNSAGLTQPILFLGWTLNYEMFFYALFSGGLLLVNTRAGVAAVVVGLLSLVGVGLVERPKGVAMSFYTNPIISEFAFGMLIALIYRDLGSTASTMIKLATSLLVLVGVIVALLFPIAFPDIPAVLVRGLSATIVVGGAVALERWGWIVKTPLLLLLGRASYSIYLTHPFVTQMFLKYFQPARVDGMLTLLLIAVILLSVSVVGVAVHFTLERPLSSALSRAFQRINQRC